jgi:hypothetical protein
MAAYEDPIVQSKTDKFICVQCKGDTSVQKAFEATHMQSDNIVHNNFLDLQRDLMELNHLLKSVVRRSVKGVILSEIDDVLTKINSLKELPLVNKDKEEKWTEVVSRGKK